MRAKKSIILLVVILTLTPMISVFGMTIPENPTFSANYWDADVGVRAGDTIYYDIVQLVLPPEADPEGVTLPDFAGNQIFLKIEAVFENYVFPDTMGTVIFYAAGLLFGEDETITVGEGLLATDFIIPAGAATPAVGVRGVPHFNGTYDPPMVFALNDAWATHELMLEAIGFTVTNDASSFSVSFVNGSGSISGAWRKSDGVLTHVLFDNVVFQDMNMTGATVELSLDRLEYNPLPVTVGDFVEFEADIANIEFDGTGELYNSINQTSLTSFLDDIASLEGKVFQKLIIDEVIGLYYSCSVYMHNFETDMLEKIAENIVYNGFLGVAQSSNHPFYNVAETSPETITPDVSPYAYFPYFAPFVTPDWEIYEGHMNLYDTIIGVYVIDILEMFSVNPSAMTFHALGGSFDFVQKRDFYYLQQAVTYNAEENYDYSSSFIISLFDEIDPQMVYDDGQQLIVNEEGYVCYTETGIPAAIAVRADVEMEFYDTGTATDTGTFEVHIDFKLRNPLYDPPELLQGGIFPGFTWLVAIPSLFMVAVAGIIYSRKKK
ncbi:MAG: hypothetical protein JJE41_09355 [Candidatus Heimdallarchaeota archaeon]|nr:hypothetical protein [Candidatus Heimdallarchaeota archaeon]